MIKIAYQKPVDQMLRTPPAGTDPIDYAISRLEVAAGRDFDLPRHFHYSGVGGGGVLFSPQSGVVFSHTHSCASVCIDVHFIVFFTVTVIRCFVCAQADSITTCCILQIGYILKHFRTTLSCCILPM